MKQSEIEPQNIYSNGSNRYRRVNEIAYDENLGWVVRYVTVGSLLIRDKIHYMEKRECNLQTFAKWALYGISEETFFDTRRHQEKERGWGA